MNTSTAELATSLAEREEKFHQLNDEVRRVRQEQTLVQREIHKIVHQLVQAGTWVNYNRPWSWRVLDENGNCAPSIYVPGLGSCFRKEHIAEYAEADALARAKHLHSSLLEWFKRYGRRGSEPRFEEALRWIRYMKRLGREDLISTPSAEDLMCFYLERPTSDQ